MVATRRSISNSSEALTSKSIEHALKLSGFKVKNCKVKLKRLNNDNIKAGKLVERNKGISVAEAGDTNMQKRQLRSNKPDRKENLSKSVPNNSKARRFTLKSAKTGVKEKNEIVTHLQSPVVTPVSTTRGKVKDNIEKQLKPKTRLSLRKRLSNVFDDLDENVSPKLKVDLSKNNSEKLPKSEQKLGKRQLRNSDQVEKDENSKKTFLKSSKTVVPDKENAIVKSATSVKSKNSRLSLRRSLSQSFNKVEEKLKTSVEQNNNSNSALNPTAKEIAPLNVSNTTTNDQSVFKTPTTIEKKMLKNERDKNVTYFGFNESFESKATTTVNTNDIYDFNLSQPSTSETEDMAFIKKLAKEGKVQIKHRRRIKNPNKINKKKFVNTTKLWRGVEKTLGVKSMKRNKATKSTIGDETISNVQLHDTSTSSSATSPHNQKDKNSFNQTETISIRKEKESNNLEKDKSIIKENEFLNTSSDDVNVTPPNGVGLTSLNNMSISPINNEGSMVMGNSTMNSHDLNPKEKASLSSSSTFSILKQTNKRPKSKKELLEYAKQFVKDQTKSSTPIANKQKNKENSEFISPLLSSISWKNKTRNSTIQQGGNDSTLIPFDENPTIMKNSSNEENIPPIDKSKTIVTKEGMLTSDKRNQIVQRSPFKQINVIEVINLPPLQLQNRNVKERTSILNKTDKLNDTIKSVRFKEDEKLQTDHNIDSRVNYFGFDEIIEDETKDDESNVTVIPKKSTLKNKLKKLKKLLPPSESLTANKKMVATVFDRSNAKKQTNIREMLSTKSIKTRSASNNKDNTAIASNSHMQKYDDGDTSERSNEPSVTGAKEYESTTTIDLFDDLIDPETTFDASKVNKTYSRKKKKPRTKYFILFSDESEEDDESEENKKRERKTRKKPEKQYDESELDKFAEEFNSIIGEAENYEFVTEAEMNKFDV